jgi:hypothetical protein
MAVSAALNSLTSPLALLGAVLLYGFYKVVQRLWFHPLSNIPGPWYAAVSTFYEFWWDCPKDGKYRFKIEEMHKNYGNLFEMYIWPNQSLQLNQVPS